LNVLLSIGKLSEERPVTPDQLIEGSIDLDRLPPMKLGLRSGEDGNLVAMRLNENSFERGDWGALRGYIIGILGSDRGPGSIQESAEIELDFDDSLRYEHVIGAVTAVAGYVDENNKVVNLVEKIKIAPPENLDSFRPSQTELEQWEKLPEGGTAEPREARLDERVRLPRSELARPPVAPYEEPILLQMTPSGEVILGDDRFAMETMPRTMVRQRRILESLGKTAGDATIVIRAHADCPAGSFQDLIAICRMQGFERFVLRARKRQAY
jgi:biopolymer transport protein ExbD